MKTEIESHNFQINATDENCDNIKINLILTKYSDNSWSAIARDSQKRLFELFTQYEKYNYFTFQNYVEWANTNSLNIYYDVFENYITLFLKGGGFCDIGNGLCQVETMENLQLLEKEIEKQKHILENLENAKKQIQDLFP
jgi:hypothetical protein